MKQLNFLILTILLFVSTTSLSQEKQTVVDSTNISNAERIIDKYGSKAVETFKDVLSDAAPIAKQGFEASVKLQIARGITNLLPLIFFLLFFYLFIREYFRITNLLMLPEEDVPTFLNRGYGAFDESNISGLLIIYLIMACILFIVTIFTIGYSIEYLTAPEWFAVKDIIELVKK